MTRFHNILLVVDDHQRDRAALEQAVALVKKNHGLLTVAQVLETGPPEMRRKAATPAASNFAVLSPMARLNAFAAPARRAGVDVITRILWGHPVRDVIGEVVQNGHDLLMVTPKWDARERWLGSTAIDLLRKCPCPVWAVKPDHMVQSGRILAAIDPWSGEEGSMLSIRILDLAAALARLTGSELHVVHAWMSYPATMVRGYGEGLAMGSGWTLDQDEDFRRASLTEFLRQAPLGGIAPRLHLRIGGAVECIVEVSEREQAGVIVMGASGRTGLARLLLGDIAEDVVRRASSSVLAVKLDSAPSPKEAAERPARSARGKKSGSRVAA